MAKDNKTKTKPSIKNFIKSLYGDKFEGLSSQDLKIITQQLNSLESDLLKELNDLATKDLSVAEKCAETIEEMTGFTFEKSDKGRGGQIFVVHAPSGKAIGGAITTKDNGKEGRIDDTTSVKDDSFISKKEVVKVIKSLDKVSTSGNLTRNLTDIIHERSKSLQEVVAVETTKYNVNLPKAITTTVVVAALLSCFVTGAMNKDNKLDNKQSADPEIKTVYVDRVIKEYIEKEETLTEIAEQLLGDTGNLIYNYGSAAQIIRAYGQEKGQENELSGKGNLTEEERIELEAELDGRLTTQDDFNKRLDEIEKDRESGVLSETEYLVEVLKLTRDVHEATVQIKGDEIVALNGVRDATEYHYNVAYIQNGITDPVHERQIAGYNNNIEAAEGAVENSESQVEIYNYVLNEFEKNPDMSAEEFKELLSTTIKNGVPQVENEQSSAIVSTENVQ